MYNLINPLTSLMTYWETHLIDTVCAGIVNKQWHRLLLQLSYWDGYNYGNTDARSDVIASEGFLNLIQTHHLSSESFILL